MSRRVAVRRAAVHLAAITALATAACGGRGDSAESGSGAGPSSEPAEVTMEVPGAPLVPEELPEGFVVEGVSTGDPAAEPGARSLLIGDPDGGGRPGGDAGPAIVVGSSSGSASIAGPRSGGGEPVSDVGVTEMFEPYVADDGPWTWVVFDAVADCIEDCLDFVAGRDVSEDDLLAVARGTTYGDAGPTVDPDAIPDGMAPLALAQPSDGIATARGVDVRLRPASSDGGDGGAGGWISIQQVEAPSSLAVLWGFWVDDPDGTTIRSQPGRAGPVGGTYDGADEARVWAEDGVAVAVLGWGVEGEVLDAVVDGLRPGTPEDLAALADAVAAREPTTADVMCGTTVLSGPATGAEGAQWIVGFEAEAEAGSGSGSGSDGYQACTGTLTAAGPSGGSSGSATLPAVGSLSAQTMSVSGGPADGTFVHGVAPPGTATVELAPPSGSPLPLALSDVGPRDQGELWYAGFQPSLAPGSTVVARDAAGAELARAPVQG